MSWLFAMLGTKKLSVALGGAFAVVTVMALSFSASEITAMSVALVALVTAIFTGTVNIIIALRSSSKVDTVERKTDLVIEKAVEIHTLTNSQLSKVTASLEVANEKINGMAKLITTMTAAKEVADKAIVVSEVTAAALPATTKPIPVEVVNEPLRVASTLKGK